MPANLKVNLPWSVSMGFRTAKPSGSLLEISFSSSSSVSEVSYVNQGTCLKVIERCYTYVNFVAISVG